MNNNGKLKGIILITLFIILIGLIVLLFLDSQENVFKLSPESLNIKINEEKRIVVHTNFKLFSEPIKWSSSDESVAIVHDGIIKGIGEGRVEIIAYTDSGLTSSVIVEVQKDGSVNPKDDDTDPKDDDEQPVVVKKKNDSIKINHVIAFYNGKEINGDIETKSGINVESTYYSDPDCTVKTTTNNAISTGGAPIDFGEYYVIGSTTGSDKYNATTSKCTKAITIKDGVVSVLKGQMKNLNDIIQLDNSKTTWTSANNTIASVNANGEVTGNGTGKVAITATDSLGKTLEYNVIVIGNGINKNYNSTTLKYWIENAQNNFVITHIWVVDAYNQMKLAITSPKTAGTNIPRIPQKANVIISNEINSKGYANKGLVAFNASAMVSEAFNTKAPSHWMGTAAIPIILNDGQMIRDSTSEKLLTGTVNVIYGMDSDSNLVYYPFNNNKNNNKEVLKKITAAGVKYTFGFRPVLVEGGVVQSTDTTPNIRQAICQIDKNNFIVMTNTVSTTSDANRKKGLTFKDMAEKMVSYGCITGFNLDGGGSTSYYYKTNATKDAIKYPTAYDGRNLADMLYFVEK